MQPERRTRRPTRGLSCRVPRPGSMRPLRSRPTRRRPPKPDGGVELSFHVPRSAPVSGTYDSGPQAVCWQLVRRPVPRWAAQLPAPDRRRLGRPSQALRAQGQRMSRSIRLSDNRRPPVWHGGKCSADSRFRHETTSRLRTRCCSVGIFARMGEATPSTSGMTSAPLWQDDANWHRRRGLSRAGAF